MNEVSEWLHSLGLGQYAEAFTENAIEADHVSDLDHEVLKSIGVSLAGHRMTILKAAASFESCRGAEAAQPRLPAPRTGDAERRQLTVMFADLVGSTALAEQLDPEDLRELTRAYQDAAKEAIEDYGGYIARYMGDGLLAYFGFPQAHEDDAERAVRSGIELVAAIRSLPARVPLAVRVGIATGTVVVGDIVGEGASQESVALGETPNLAARLQGIASPNSVVLSAVTKSLLGARFELQTLGPQQLKGISSEVEAFRAQSVREGLSRFDAAHSSGVARIMGRDSELSVLTHRWAQAREGEGQVVLLQGESGIGKSRLTQAVREAVSDKGTVVQQLQCSPYLEGSPFHPVVDLMERAAGFSYNDNVEAKLAKLAQSMGLLLANERDAMPVIAALLSLPVDRLPGTRLPPEAQRAATIDLLLMLIEAVARPGPVLMILEDAHWADPSTLELFDVVVERIQTLPILLLVTFRPDFEPPWIHFGHVTSYSLNRLSRDACAAMVHEMTDARTLPESVVEEIIARADGIPLFIEELTETVLESATAKGDGDAPKPLPPFTIPASLRDSLIARLDTLGQAERERHVATVRRSLPEI